MISGDPALSAGGNQLQSPAGDLSGGNATSPVEWISIFTGSRYKVFNMLTLPGNGPQYATDSSGYAFSLGFLRKQVSCSATWRIIDASGNLVDVSGAYTGVMTIDPLTGYVAIEESDTTPYALQALGYFSNWLGHYVGEVPQPSDWQEHATIEFTDQSQVITTSVDFHLPDGDVGLKETSGSLTCDQPYTPTQYAHDLTALLNKVDFNYALTIANWVASNPRLLVPEIGRTALIIGIQYADPAVNPDYTASNASTDFYGGAWPLFAQRYDDGRLIPNYLPSDHTIYTWLPSESYIANSSIVIYSAQAVGGFITIEPDSSGLSFSLPTTTSGGVDAFGLVVESQWGLELSSHFSGYALSKLLFLKGGNWRQDYQYLVGSGEIGKENIASHTETTVRNIPYGSGFQPPRIEGGDYVFEQPGGYPDPFYAYKQNFWFYTFVP